MRGSRYIRGSNLGGLAQLARAVGSQSTGQGFESPILQKPSLFVTLTTILLILVFAGCRPEHERPVDLEQFEQADIFVYPDDFDIERSEGVVIERFGDPDSIEEIQIPGTEVNGETDIRRIYRYDGLEFIFYQSAREDFHILAATVLTSGRYAIDLGLRVGMGRSVATDVLGGPDFVQDESHVFSYGNSPSERMNIELVIQDDIVTEIAVAPDLP